MAVRNRNNRNKNNKKNNNSSNNKNNNKQGSKDAKKMNHVDVILAHNTEPPLVFLDLTHPHIVEEQEGEENLQHERLFTSTHDLAELMLYSFVDNTPHVADLLWSKQLLDQEDFLTLTSEQEWSDEPFINFSTHEPLVC